MIYISGLVLVFFPLPVHGLSMSFFDLLLLLIKLLHSKAQHVLYASTKNARGVMVHPNWRLFTQPRVSEQRSICDLNTGFLRNSSAGQRKRSQPTLRTPRLVLVSTTPLIWCGRTDFGDQSAQNRCNDDPYYLVNLVVSRTFLMSSPAPANRSLSLEFQYRESGLASWSMVPGPAVVNIIQ